MKLQELFEYFNHALYEMRKNPTVNVRENPIDILRKYKDNPNIFIHFTNDIDYLEKIHVPEGNPDNDPNIKLDPSSGKHYKHSKIKHHTPQDKLGMNYHYRWNTPMGIYGYHLPTFWKKHKLDSVKSSLHRLGAFKTDAKYIYIFEWSGKEKYIPDMAQYDESDWENDYKKLLKLFPNSKEIINKAISGTNITGSIGKLWNVTRILGKDAKGWNYLFRKLGYSGFNDIGEGAFKQFEYEQAVFFDTKSIKSIYKLINTHSANPVADFISGKNTDYKELYSMVSRNFSIMRYIPNTLRGQIGINVYHTLEKFYIHRPFNNLPTLLRHDVDFIKNALLNNFDNVIETYPFSIIQPIITPDKQTLLNIHRSTVFHQLPQEIIQLYLNNFKLSNIQQVIVNNLQNIKSLPDLVKHLENMEEHNEDMLINIFEQFPQISALWYFINKNKKTHVTTNQSSSELPSAKAIGLRSIISP